MDDEYYRNKWIIHLKFTNGLSHPNTITGNPLETAVPFLNTISTGQLYKYVYSIFYRDVDIGIPPKNRCVLSLKPFNGTSIHASYVLPHKNTVLLSDFFNQHIAHLERSNMVSQYTNYVIYVCPFLTAFPGAISEDDIDATKT